MNVITSLCIAIAMYSKIPVKNFEWTEDKMKYSLGFFPVVGIVIGFLELCAYYVIRLRLNMGSLFYGAIATAIPILVTGGIHMDGFIDTVDATSSYQSKERRLEILKDPHIGAFAVIKAAVYFILYLGFASEVNSLEAISIIAVGFVLERALSGLCAIYLKNAKGSGSLNTFKQATTKKSVSVMLFVWLVLSLVAIGYVDLTCFVSVLVVVVVFTLFYFVKSFKLFGGITGDLEGWYLQMLELFILMIAVIMR